MVLTAAVRAMLMISDIFTQETQFVWMLGTLSDLYKVLGELLNNMVTKSDYHYSLLQYRHLQGGVRGGLPGARPVRG